VIDLHAHILPAVDDGPPDMEAAVEMARAAVAAGTRAMAATSHVEWSLELGPDDLEPPRAALAERLAAEGVPLEVLQGGEIAPDRLRDLDDATLRRLTLGAGRHVLLECPLSPVGAALGPMVADLHDRGFEVLLAHPERSPSLQRDPALLARLVEQGALAQVTSGAITGQYGGVPQRTALRMLADDLIHVLASDAHSARTRPPDLRPAAAAIGDERFAWMTEAVPGAIVAGQPVPAAPAAPLPARGLRERLRAWSRR
jgi:protein-tyrosine phosphatase